MDRRLVTSLAGVLGAAALVAAPVTLSASASPAANVVAQPSPKPNQEAYWVAFLEAEGYENVECTKYEPVEDPFIVPALTDPDRVYVLAVVKGGSGEGENELFWDPEPGDELSHPTAGNSHVILCTAEEDEDTSTPTPTVTTTTPTPTVTTTTPTPTVTTTTPTPTVTTTTPAPTTTTPVPTHTGPRVETDRPGVASSPAALLAGAALLASGIGALVFARRRQGNHR